MYPFSESCDCEGGSGDLAITVAPSDLSSSVSSLGFLAGNTKPVPEKLEFCNGSIFLSISNAALSVITVSSAQLTP